MSRCRDVCTHLLTYLFHRKFGNIGTVGKVLTRVRTLNMSVYGTGSGSKSYRWKAIEEAWKEVRNDNWESSDIFIECQRSSDPP